MRLLHSGKVRDIYEDRGDIVLVASDRLSVFDVILPTPVPDKGRILTQMAAFGAELTLIESEGTTSSRRPMCRPSSRGARCDAGSWRCCRWSASPAAT